MKKVCIITCYFDPDYVRARTLRAGLLANKDVETIVVKNRHKGLLRYPEVLLKILAARLKHHPDVYILTFRGQEILPFVLMLRWPKPILFDEFIVPLAWATQEGHHNTMRTRLFKLMARVSAPLYKSWLKSCEAILADTEVHAKASAELSGLPYDKYKVIPVSTDEQVFAPIKVEPAKDFQVFYYGNMLPLHGLQYLLDAAVQLRDNKRVKFLCVGGSHKTNIAIAEAQQQGARIEHKSWVPFDELPKLAAQSALCVGGPLGGTMQARMVITGKTYQFLCMGRPTLIGEIDEATPFKDKENCLLVPQADADAIVKAIQWAAASPRALDKVGQNGRDIYEQYYSNKQVQKLLADILTI